MPKTKTKKAPLLTILLLSVALSAYAQADLKTNFTSRIIDNGRAVEITGYTGSSADVRTPATIQGLPVTAIGN